MFEDHGDTFAYEQEIYLEKKFSVRGDGKNLIIQQITDGLYTPNYELYDYNVIGLPFAVTKIFADDKEITNFNIDDRKRLRFKSNKNFMNIKILGA